MTEILTWLQTYQPLLWWLGALSIVTFLGTLIVVPLLIVRIPADYFLRDKQQLTDGRRQHPLARLFSFVLKNFLGLIFVLAGIAMLVLPGQGILTILIGLMMMNFPGKHALEQRLVQQPTVLGALNWMRAKANQPALIVPATTATAEHQKDNA
jgi:hypothetical protein